MCTNRSAAAKARVEVIGADDRLQAVGQDGLLRPAAGVLLALADEDEVVHAQAAGDLREARLADDEALDPRQLPFRLVREGFVEVLGDDEAEHGVAEELQPLVVLPVLARLVGERAVGERLVEELQPSEADARRASRRAGAPSSSPGSARRNGLAFSG